MGKYQVFVSSFSLCLSIGCGDGSEGSELSEAATGQASTTGASSQNTNSTGVSLQTTTSGAGSTSGGSTSAGSLGPDVELEPGGGSCGELKVSQGCAGEVLEGEGIPLDIQVIFDQSGSMATVVDAGTGATRLEAVYAAIDSFVNDPASIGLGVGVSYFGYQPIGATSCDVADYSTPAVSIGLLPGNAANLLNSLGAVVPTGETPTGSAIRGGCSISQAHRAKNPGRAVVNLLVTDGEPKAPVTSKTQPCLPTLDDAVLAASECHAQGAGIATFVLGVGPSLDNLNQIAAAGGTEHAYLVAEDSSQGVLEALNSVRSVAQIPCDLAIDTSRALSYAETTVVMLAPDCTLTRLSQQTNAASCGAAGGFYFDNPSAPSQITLCESSCGAVKQPSTKLLYSIGCGIEDIK